MTHPGARAALVALLVLGGVACSGSTDEGTSGDETWCDVVRASNALDDEFDAVEPGDAGALESVLDEIGGLGDRFRDAAPDEISDEVETYAAANDALVEVFAIAEYDIDQLDGAAIQTLIAGVESVETEIDVYTVAECGEPLGPDDT